MGTTCRAPTRGGDGAQEKAKSAALKAKGGQPVRQKAKQKRPATVGGHYKGGSLTPFSRGESGFGMREDGGEDRNEKGSQRKNRREPKDR